MRRATVVALVLTCGVLAGGVLTSGALAQSTDAATSTPADTDTSTPTDTATPTPTDTASPTPTEPPVATATGTTTASSTPEPTATPSTTATDTATATSTAAETATPTATETSRPAETDAIEDCTAITEPGYHELASDVGHDEAATCIDVQADDVVLDGNGHAIVGPGPNATDDIEPYRGVYVNWSDNVTVKDVELEGWSPGVRAQGAGLAGENLTLENLTVRNSDDGVVLVETGDTDLRDVTAEDNVGFGIDTDRIGSVQGSDVTLRGNERGLGTWDSHGIRLESSRVVDNDENGINLYHHSSLDLRDVEVSGNGADGVEARSSGSGFRVSMTMEGGAITENGENGVTALLDAEVALNGTKVTENGHDGIRALEADLSATDVTVRDNDGLEVDSRRGKEWGGLSGGNLTADGLAVGDSSRTTFENESVGLEPVDRDSLPELPTDRTAVGYGLNVSGPVKGPVELELDVERDAENAELWRHDGVEWDTAVEAPTVDGGTLAASVDRNGTYAPVASEDASNGTATPTASPTATSTDPATAAPSDTDTPTGTDGESTDGSNDTDEETTEESDTPNGDGDGQGVVTVNDAPGFGAVAALLGLLAAALVARRS